MVTGEALRLMRVVKGYKQSYVANLLGISQQAYSKLENQKFVNPHRSEQIKIALNASHIDFPFLSGDLTLKDESKNL